jgi:antitoxin ParD1/3/4
MPRTTSVILSSYFEQFVKSQLATGRYSSVSEVIRESLRLMEDREAQLSALRTELDIGIDQLDRGESIEWHSLKDELSAR